MLRDTEQAIVNMQEFVVSLVILDPARGQALHAYMTQQHERRLK